VRGARLLRRELSIRCEPRIIRFGEAEASLHTFVVDTDLVTTEGLLLSTVQLGAIARCGQHSNWRACLPSSRSRRSTSPAAIDGVTPTCTLRAGPSSPRTRPGTEPFRVTGCHGV
jgi:hypothetical protein